MPPSRFTGMITKQRLTIGDRAGQFPGMLDTRTFQIVFVDENHGVGIAASDRPDKVVEYARETDHGHSLGCARIGSLPTRPTSRARGKGQRPEKRAAVFADLP